MKTNTHRLLPFVAIAGLALTASSANAALTSKYGILDLAANGGINPNTGNAWADGDQYRLAFHTANKFNASSTDINTYNTVVTAEAQLNASLVGSTWKAMISTELGNVKDNTGTADLTGGAGVGGAGVPVYAMNGTTAIARNNADIWDVWSSPFANVDSGFGANGEAADSNVRLPGSITGGQSVHYSPFLDQFGAGDSGVVHGENVWSGGSQTGVTHGTQFAGAISNTQWGSSNSNNTSRMWVRGNSNNTSTSLSLYALSDLMTVTDVVPEPSTTALLGLGGLALIFRRRK
tara:strand:- start:4106 stop:4978 length:873 start_codon:yes stop_codon:yes gene_type:complete